MRKSILIVFFSVFFQFCRIAAMEDGEVLSSLKQEDAKEQVVTINLDVETESVSSPEQDSDEEPSVPYAEVEGGYPPDTIIRIDRLEREIKDLEEGRVLRDDEEHFKDYLCGLIASRGVGDNLEEEYFSDLCAKFYQKNRRVRSKTKRRYQREIVKRRGRLDSDEKDPGLKKRWFADEFMDFLARELKDQTKRGDNENARADDERERADQAHVRTTRTSWLHTVNTGLTSLGAIATVVLFIYKSVVGDKCDCGSQ